MNNLCDDLEAVLGTRSQSVAASADSDRDCRQCASSLSMSEACTAVEQLGQLAPSWCSEWHGGCVAEAGAAICRARRRYLAIPVLRLHQCVVVSLAPVLGQPASHACPFADLCMESYIATCGRGVHLHGVDAALPCLPAEHASIAPSQPTGSAASVGTTSERPWPPAPAGRSMWARTVQTGWARAGQATRVAWHRRGCSQPRARRGTHR